MPSSPPLSDTDDVRLVLDGDRMAFGRLYDKHARGVRAVVVAVSGDFKAVEDMTQETFLRGYRRLATLRKPAAFGFWIQGFARLVARERRRQLSRDRHRFEAEQIEIAVSDETSAFVENEEELLRVLSAVAELPEQERLVLHAYYFHEINIEQAAAEINLSRSGFYKVLDRGIKRLRKKMGVDPLPPMTTRKLR